MKCQIKNCEETALLAFGNRWICGKCYMKILKKENEKKEQLIKELEDDN